MAIINGDENDNVLWGTFGDDIIDGKERHDTIIALSGDDYIYGGIGSDLIFAGAGDDHINGGNNDDLLVGGAGADVFIFDPNFGNDIIYDFKSGIDKINIDPSLYNGIDDILSRITYNNGNARIDLDANNIFVRGISPNNPLTKDDFVEHTVIDFEDLPESNGIPLPDDYQGFNWKLDDGGNAYYYEGVSAGYGVLGTQLIYNAGGATSVTVTRSDGSDFYFEGVDLVSGIAANQDIDIFGYLDGVLVGSTNVSLTNYAVLEVDVDWGQIDTLVLDPQLASGNYFAMDNFDFVL